MALSDSDFRAWLADESKQAVILIEAGYYDGGAQTAYWSDVGYIDPTNPAGRNYLPVVTGDVVVDETLDRAVLSTVEIILYDQALLTWRFVGYGFTVWFGDRRWPRADFVKQATEKINNVLSPNRNTLQFQFADLRAIYFDQLVNGNGRGLNAGLPFVFGRVFNMEPLRVNSNNYRFYTPAMFIGAEQARDNGVPVTITLTDFTADGKGDGLQVTITVASPPAGKLTLDLRAGHPELGGWTDSGIKRLLERMNSYIQLPIPLGPTVTSAPTADLGYVFYQYGTVNEMLTQMCDSIGLNPRINANGALDLVRIDTTGTATRLITDSNLSQPLQLLGVEPPYKQLELGYRRNFALQGTDTLAGSVSAANSFLYSREYTYAKSTRTLTGYPFVRNQKRDTLLATQVDAEAELLRRWTLRAVEHRSYSCEGDATFVADGIGDTITIQSADYGFGAGIDVVVIGNKKNLSQQRCGLEIWV